MKGRECGWINWILLLTIRYRFDGDARILCFAANLGEAIVPFSCIWSSAICVMRADVPRLTEDGRAIYHAPLESARN